jgi:hypothetical protein
LVNRLQKILGDPHLKRSILDSARRSARNMLIEFVGGEPGKMLREQFGPPLTTAGV